MLPCLGSGTGIWRIFDLIGLPASELSACEGWTGDGGRSRKEKDMGTHNHVGFG